MHHHPGRTTILKRILSAALTLLTAVTIGGVAASAPASAHSSGQYYTGSRWPSNGTVQFALNAGWPGGETTSRVLDARNQWGYWDQGAEPNLTWTLPDGVNYGSWSNPCTLTSGNNTAIVFWADLESQGSTVVGYTRACSSNGTRTRATVAFDQGNSWYWGNGDAPAWATDLWSVASHEWGHLMGFQQHLPEFTIGICPTGGDWARHTMCPQVFSGQEMMRDLGEHDGHTHQAAYPW